MPLVPADPKEDLRGVHWQIGYQASDGAALTEARTRYGNPRGRPATLDEGQAAELRKSHIDLAAGADRSCSSWQCVMRHEMSKNAADKFGCKKPEGLLSLGAELRKSSVSLSDLKMPPPLSEQRDRFAVPENIDQVQSFADTLGKLQRMSSVKIEHGQDKNTDDWQSAMKAEMSRFAKEKYEVGKPEGFETLGKELRKSSVPLPGAAS